MKLTKLRNTQSFWPSYRAVWRWHFYAGLFSIPVILWLSVTGSIYLFKPQIEQWIDRPYDRFHVTGVRADPATQVESALAAVPGANFHAYQLPRTQGAAAQILVGRGATEYRVYVHPATSEVLNVEQEDKRLMQRIQHLHGEFLLGDRGSLVVELAASWAIVLILTGLYLWWPRQTKTLAGVLYVRLHQGKRVFWRDLHAVTGVWISAFALFLLFSGLPWAKSWGGNLKKLRAITSAHGVHQDWTTGSSSERAQRAAMNNNALADEHAGHHMANMPGMVMQPDAYAPLAKLISTVEPMHLAYPVLIGPPMSTGGPWSARSDAQNRPLRVNLLLDPSTGAVVHRDGFSQKNMLDRLIAIGIAAHEGQLLTPINQAISFATAMGLVLICVSAVAMWWRRREKGVLGAPFHRSSIKPSPLFVMSLVALCVYLPLLGISLLALLAFEWAVLKRIPPIAQWLGLNVAS